MKLMYRVAVICLVCMLATIIVLEIYLTTTEHSAAPPGASNIVLSRRGPKGFVNLTFSTFSDVSTPPPDPEDLFEDLQTALDELRTGTNSPVSNRNLYQTLGIKLPRKTAAAWERFHAGICQNELYPVTSSIVDQVLWDMAHRRIIQLEQMDGGTQLKLTVKFDNGGLGLVKFMRFPREHQANPNHFYFSDFERHTSEIAAFHLDRVLGFRQAPPVVGRLFNITSEIYPLADQEFLRTFFVSPANNLCFHGNCKYYCDAGHAFCGHPDMVEGSIAMMLPDEDEIANRRSQRNPWRRSYHKRKLATWETQPQGYCDRVREPGNMFHEPARMLDLIDITIFDFLIGNMDRHHYELFTIFNNNSKPLRLDQGRGFGLTDKDEISILTPLFQCCVVRQSTVHMLLELQGGQLGKMMKQSLSKDPLHPVLLEGFYAALDRRLRHVLAAVRACVQQKGSREVLLPHP